MIKKSTYVRAFESCEEFFAETGQMPTIEAVKPMIGVNSPSIISSAIKDWKAALSKVVRKDQGLSSKSIPPALQEAVDALWQQAVDEAKASTSDLVDSLETKKAELDAREHALMEEKERVSQLVALTERRFQEEIAYLKKESERLASEVKAAKEEALTSRDAATASEKQNAVLTEEIRQEKEKLQRLEAQYDQLHGWSLQRIEEEKEIHRQKTQHEMSRLQAEAIRSKQDVDMLQTKNQQLLKQENGNRDRISRLEASLSEGKLQLAAMTLDNAKLQNALNAKEELIRTLIDKTAKKT